MDRTHATIQKYTKMMKIRDNVLEVSKRLPKKLPFVLSNIYGLQG